MAMPFAKRSPAPTSRPSSPEKATGAIRFRTTKPNTTGATRSSGSSTSSRTGGASRPAMTRPKNPTSASSPSQQSNYGCPLSTNARSFDCAMTGRKALHLQRWATAKYLLALPEYSVIIDGHRRLPLPALWKIFHSRSAESPQRGQSWDIQACAQRSPMIFWMSPSWCVRICG